MSHITSLGLPSGGSPVVTITGNVGGAVTPDGAGNFNVLGADFLISTGNPGTNTISFDIDDKVKTTAVYSQEKAFIDELLGSVASDGTTVTLTLTTASGADTNVLFSDGFHDLNIGTTPATLVLTPGTDSTPMINYVYYDQATITLSVSTSGWPATDHAKVAELLIPSASRVQTKGIYNAHNYHTDVEGHIIHMSDWIREQNATYVNGISQSLTITTNAGSADNVIFTSTAGEVLQLHSHDFPAFIGTPDMYVVNGASAYDITTDINTLLTDSSGGSLSGKFFSLVVWGVVSPNGVGSKLMVNLPSGGYTSANYLLKDVKKKTDYSIPASFKGTGFLIARLDLHHTTADSGTWALEKLVDLRGLYPSLVAGGGSVNTTEFLDTEFKILDDTNVTKELAFEVSPVSTGTTRTITMCNSDLDLTSPLFTGSVTAGTGVTITTGDLEVFSGNINLPATTATDGIINVNSDRFISAYGSSNGFMGINSGNLTLSGSGNIGIGDTSLASLTSGYGNTAIGKGSMNSITSGYRNVAIGTDAMNNANVGSIWNVAIGFESMINATSGGGSTFVGAFTGGSVDGNNNSGLGYESLKLCSSGQSNTSLGTRSLNAVTTGSFNIAIGHGADSPYGAGSNYTGAESSNIVIQNLGVVGDSNTIRLGTQGSSNSQQDKTFIAGIYNTTPSGGSDNVVVIDSDGQLGAQATLSVANGGTGAASLQSHGIIIGNGTSAVSAMTLTDGQVLIGATLGDPSTSTLTAGSGISITNGMGSITIASTATSGMSWGSISGTSATVANNHGYITQNVSLTTITLPVPSLGARVRIAGYGAGGWKIKTNGMFQTIRFGSSVTTTTTGYIQSTYQADSVELLCVYGDSMSGQWSVISSVGNITIV